jgi:indole-3-glycerol phosphate synthase
MQIIAEVKTFSPFGWESNRSWGELFDIANKIGDMISIHTDPRWHGSFDLIEKATCLTNKPILAKGIHASDDDITRALDAGASYVLVVGRMPSSNIEQCLLEPSSIEELKSLPPDVKAVWNSRDLGNGGIKTETFEDARHVYAGWLCQASNIISMADVDKSADAILVGSHLAEFAMTIT